MNTLILLALFVGDPGGWNVGPCDLECKVIELQKSVSKLQDENAALKTRLSAVETKLNAITAARAPGGTPGVAPPAPPVIQQPAIFYEPQPIQFGPRRCVNGVCRPR